MQGIFAFVIMATLVGAEPMLSSEESLRRITEVIERPVRNSEMKARDYQQALTMLDRFARDYPDAVSLATADFLRANAYLGLGQTEYAQSSLEAALAGPLPNDHLVVANYLHGRTLLENGQNKDGVAALRRAIGSNPNHPAVAEVRFILAYALMENLDAIEAQGQLDTLMATGGPQWVLDGAATLRKNLRWIGQAAPTFNARTLDGRQISLRDFEGRVVLIDFWASWCPPCIAMLPDLQNVYAKYRTRGFEVIGMSLDRTRSDLFGFLRSNDMPWIHVHENAEIVADRYGVEGIPMTFLLDRRGTIAAVNLHGERLAAAVERLLSAR